MAVLASTQWALAADLRARMPMKAPQPVVAALYSWTGCYVGVHGGYAWGRKRVYDEAGIEIQGARHDVDGPLVGGQLGCNLQRDRWVFGIEGQAAWTDIDGEVPRDLSLTPPVFTAFRTKIDILGSVAARLGYAFGATGQTLLFVKGGAAFAHEQYFSTGLGLAFLDYQTDEHLRWGFMVGTGFEQALSANWSFKGEYNYSHFGRKTYELCNAVAGCDSIEVRQHIHLVKVGINYRWGPAPVAARY
jgi:outer membrane immunogenic protein